MFEQPCISQSHYYKTKRAKPEAKLLYDTWYGVWKIFLYNTTSGPKYKT